MTGEEEYGLVMPFVVCRTNGGVYDDEAFVAGFAAGSLEAELAMCKAMPQGMAAIPHARLVHAGIVPQLDLIAMQHGFAMIASDPDEYDWAWVEFSIAPPPGDGL